MKRGAHATERLCYRLTDPAFTGLDGVGGRRKAGRWHVVGEPVVYCGRSQPGAVLESLARLQGLGRLPPRAVLRIHIPAGVVIEAIEATDVPGWDFDDYQASQVYGSAWLREGRSVALMVPAVTSKPWGENVLLNPAHPDMARLTVDVVPSFAWDGRLQPLGTP